MPQQKYPVNPVDPVKFLIKIAVLILAFTLWTQVISAADPVRVFVSITPQKYFVEKIGGDLVDVSVMVAPGASPATYEPKPRQMAALARARIYFAVGVPFETAWLKKIASSNPKLITVPTHAGIERIPMAAHAHDSHDHGHTNHGNRETEDPHIWLSPPLVKIQAKHIRDALAAADADNRAAYEKGYRNFISDIDALDAGIKSMVAGLNKGPQFMVFHPSWGYFARAYGLSQVAVEVEGKEPRPAELKRIIAHAKANRIRVIFVQPQFSAKGAKVVADAIGGKVAFADPLAYDWPDNLRKVAEMIRDSLMEK